MVYNKAIIDLISEARRRVSADDKPSIKLANPDMFYELARIYHGSKDVVLKTLIKEVFLLVGEGWPEKLTDQPGNISSAERDKYTTKIYRGVTQVIHSLPEKKNQPKTGPKRIYRGQVIND